MTANTENSPSPCDTGSGARSARLARQIVEEVATSAKVPGMSVAVATPERILFAGAAGYADLQERRPSSVDDQYPWFSMTKIATATTAMRLHAEGTLDLDAPIGSYLAGYQGHPRHGHPTTRELLNHTAGLGNPIPVRWVRPVGGSEDTALLDRVIAGHGTPKHAVGARAAYSNIGYLLVGEVIAAATGRTIQTCVREGVLARLGMHDTGYDYKPDVPRAVGYIRIPRVVVPALRAALPGGLIGPRVRGHTALQPFLVSGAAYGGLVGSVSDAVRLAAAHAADVSDPHPVLEQPHLEEMRTIAAPGKPFDHGIGWFRKPVDAGRTPSFVEHYGTGGGHWNATRIYPGLRLAMVAMTNTTFAWDFDRLFTQLTDLSWS